MQDMRQSVGAHKTLFKTLHTFPTPMSVWRSLPYSWASKSAAFLDIFCNSDQKKGYTAPLVSAFLHILCISEFLLWHKWGQSLPLKGGHVANRVCRRIAFVLVDVNNMTGNLVIHTLMCIRLHYKNQPYYLIALIQHNEE